MELQARPPHEPAEDESRFLIHSRVEITFILRAVLQAGEMVSTHFNQARDSALTALLFVDAQKGFFVFDAPSDPALVKSLLGSNRIAFVSRQDKIKIRWEATGVQSAQFEGMQALRAAIPDTLLKFQRREFYRAETPITRPVRCTIPLPEGGMVNVNLFDISLGGVGLTGFPEDFPREIGRELPGCTITLPDVGVLAVTLQIRNTLDVPLRDGKLNRRAGCMFRSLPSGADNMIQRYIIRLERERRARTV